MPVQGEASFTVSLDSLVAATRAVEPHALRGRKGDDVLQTVRFVAGPDLLHVVATNGTTAAVALVQIDPDSDTRGTRLAEDDGTFTLDADPSEVRQIISRFTKGASSKKDAPRRTIRMHWTDRMLRLTDITEQTATLDLESPDLDDVPARGLDVLVSPPSADFPPVLDDIRAALAAVGETTQGKPLVSSWSTLSLFSSLGSVAPKADITIEPSGSSTARGFVVTAGSWFAGTLPSRFDSDSLARRARARDVLLHRMLGTPLTDPEYGDSIDDIPVQYHVETDEDSDRDEDVKALNFVGPGGK